MRRLPIQPAGHPRLRRRDGGVLAATRPLPLPAPRVLAQPARSTRTCSREASRSSGRCASRTGASGSRPAGARQPRRGFRADPDRRRGRSSRRGSQRASLLAPAAAGGGHAGRDHVRAAAPRAGHRGPARLLARPFEFEGKTLICCRRRLARRSQRGPGEPAPAAPDRRPGRSPARLARRVLVASARPFGLWRRCAARGGGLRRRPGPAPAGARRPTTSSTASARPSTRCSTAWRRRSSASARSSTTRATSCARRSRPQGRARARAALRRQHRGAARRDRLGDRGGRPPLALAEALLVIARSDKGRLALHLRTDASRRTCSRPCATDSPRRSDGGRALALSRRHDGLTRRGRPHARRAGDRQPGRERAAPRRRRDRFAPSRGRRRPRDPRRATTGRASRPTSSLTPSSASAAPTSAREARAPASASRSSRRSPAPTAAARTPPTATAAAPTSGSSSPASRLSRPIHRVSVERVAQRNRKETRRCIGRRNT